MAAVGPLPTTASPVLQHDVLTTAALREYPMLTVLRQTPQLQFLHTMIRDRNTANADFVFYADRLIRLVVEEGLALLPTQPQDITTPTDAVYHGAISTGGICGVSIMRAGESMEHALRDTCRAIRIGKVLIQRDESSRDKAPDERYNYAKLPADIRDRWVFLLDPMLATGGSAMKAPRLLTRQYNVLESRIVFLNVVACPEGIAAVAKAFPQVRIVTSAVDSHLNEKKYIVPGLGDFGDRYFGTTLPQEWQPSTPL